MRTIYQKCAERRSLPHRLVVEPDNDGLPTNLFNAEQVADIESAMQSTVEYVSIMRQPGLHTSNQTEASAPAVYSRGAVPDFLTRDAKAMYWNFVDQYAHLPQLHEYVLRSTGTLSAQQLVQKM
ncbi:hypothetical protein WJX79_010150 [Trebouxia sp. C0005]